MKIAGVEFDNVLYDRDADVLYLQVGSSPRAAADFDASPEGHSDQFVSFLDGIEPDA